MVQGISIRTLAEEKEYSCEGQWDKLKSKPLISNGSTDNTFTRRGVIVLGAVGTIVLGVTNTISNVLYTAQKVAETFRSFVNFVTRQNGVNFDQVKANVKVTLSSTGALVVRPFTVLFHLGRSAFGFFTFTSIAIQDPAGLRKSKNPVEV